MSGLSPLNIVLYLLNQMKVPDLHLIYEIVFLESLQMAQHSFN